MKLRCIEISKFRTLIYGILNAYRKENIRLALASGIGIKKSSLILFYIK